MILVLLIFAIGLTRLPADKVQYCVLFCATFFFYSTVLWTPMPFFFSTKASCVYRHHYLPLGQVDTVMRWTFVFFCFVFLQQPSFSIYSSLTGGQGEDLYWPSLVEGTGGHSDEVNICVVLQQPFFSFYSSLTGGWGVDLYWPRCALQPADSETVAPASSLAWRWSYWSKFSPTFGLPSLI